MIGIDINRISEVLLADGPWHLVVQGTFKLDNVIYRDGANEPWLKPFTRFSFTEMVTAPPGSDGKKTIAGPLSSIVAVRQK